MLFINVDFKFYRSIYSIDYRSIEECSMEFVFFAFYEFLRRKFRIIYKFM